MRRARGNERRCSYRFGRCLDEGVSIWFQFACASRACGVAQPLRKMTSSALAEAFSRAGTNAVPGFRKEITMIKNQNLRTGAALALLAFAAACGGSKKSDQTQPQIAVLSPTMGETL